MPNHGQIQTVTAAAERLCNSLRQHAEAYLRRDQLWNVDKDEYIDNVDTAMTTRLNCIHSLIDALNTAGITCDPYDYADTLACLLIRNARHHNHNVLYDSFLKRMYKSEAIKFCHGIIYIHADYAKSDPTGSNWMDYFVCAKDFIDNIENQPGRFMSKRQEKLQLLENGIALGEIREEAIKNGVPLDRTYINLEPILMNSVTRLFRLMNSNGIPFEGYDSKIYSEHFIPNEIANLNETIITTRQVDLDQ